LLESLKSHPSATPFLLPVSTDDEPPYYDVIKRPMDLSTMESKLEADAYATPEDFIRDARLMLQNCYHYYEEEHPFVKSSESLERFMWQMIKSVPEWYHLEP